MNVETEDDQVDEVPICMTVEQVIGKPIIVVEEMLLLVPDLHRENVIEKVTMQMMIANDGETALEVVRDKLKTRNTRGFASLG